MTSPVSVDPEDAFPSVPAEQRRLQLQLDASQAVVQEALEALRATEEQLRQFAAQVPGVVFRVQLMPNGERHYLFVSEGVRALYGISPAEVMADGNLLQTFRHPDDFEAVKGEMERAVTSALPMSMQFRLKMPDGVVKWVEMTSSIATEAGGNTYRNGIMLDITARKLAEIELRESEERWKLALESTGDGVWDWNLTTGEEVFSQRYIEMYGFEVGELASQAEQFDVRTHPQDIAQMLQDRQAHFDGLTPNYINEHRIQCKDGSWKWILTRGMVITRDATGKPLRMIGTHTDISQRKAAETLIWQQANFDALTGLPNRRMLREQLTQAIEKSNRLGLQLAVLFIDLDHFKEVNDTLGHGKGDQLLVEAARRIQMCADSNSLVARMGGDEFTVVLPELAQAHHLATGHVARVVNDILKSLETVFQLDADQVFVSASIGITMCPTDATEIENLFKNADQALYVAKGAGRNRFSFFTEALEIAAQNRIWLTHDLRLGLALAQFHVVYQPIVALASGRIHKAEALLRWHHPKRGLISPATFIPVAETSGLIIEIGDWVFHQVARQVQAWRAGIDSNFQVSINKSPVQFHHDRGTNKAWFEHLTSLALPGNAVAVEITEGLLLDASSGVTQQLLELREAGIQVSLDDFGTGYSSLSYLQKFQIDYIKIDQSFVRHLIPDSTDLALCKAIIVMAHELGMKVIAEGIETALQRDLLLAAGCDYGQGYLFARPVPPADFEALLR